MKLIRIMLVEDSPEYREGIAFALGKEPDIELATQFGTADQALRSLQDLSTRNVPDLILLDLNLPGLNGIDALPFFKQAIPGTKIIVLTQSDREADVFAAISAGANGYLLKSATRSQLAEGIRSVMNGGASLDPCVANYILKTFQSKPRLKDSKETLSERELQILTLLGEGLQRKEISDRLNLSTHTVSNHTRHIYEKLEVQNSPAAIHKAHCLGLFK
jgi:DNA-binding NarL/FixJ family response regulator